MQEPLSLHIKTILLHYVRTQLVIVGIVGLVTWVALALMGVKFALLLGIMTGSLSVIPVFGMVSSAIVALVVSMVDGHRLFPTQPLFFDAFVILIVYGMINFLVDVFLAPLLSGKMTNMHPVVLFVAVLLGTVLFGILGALFTVPVLLVSSTIWRYYVKRSIGKRR